MTSTNGSSKSLAKTADMEKISLVSDACKKVSLAVDLLEISRIAHAALSEILPRQDTLLGVINRQTQSLETYCQVSDTCKINQSSIALTDKWMPAIQCIESKKPVVIENLANYAIDEKKSTAFNQIISSDISSIFCWPLVTAGQVIGVLCIHSYQENKFYDSMSQLVDLLSHAMAGAIFHVNHLEEIDHQRRAALVSDDHIRTISEISREINSTLDLETVLWTVYQHVNKLMDATVFGIGIYDSDEELIKIDLAMEKGKRYQPYTRTMTDKNQFPVWCIEHRESVFINDVRKEGGRYFEVNEYDNWEHNRPVLEDDAFSGVPLALIYVPMMLNDMVYGFITVQTFEANRYKKVHVDILGSIAGYTVNAIANASAHQELVQARESLRIAKREAEKTAEAKMHFLANMSHEIRTPMNIILGFMNVVLEHDQLEEDDKNHINTAHSAAQNLLSIIDDILDVTKNESGKLSLEMIPFDLKQMLEESANLLSFKAEEKGLDFRLKYHPRLTSYFKGDPHRINQVLLNLTGNAIKFTDQGHVQVTVSQYENTDKLLFSISDTGIGMSKQEQATIFESFTQADTSITRNFGGTGLGTTISRQLVNAMGGDIWVDSNPGKGTTFNFTLPLVVVRKSEIPEYKTKKKVKDTSTKSLDILLAEDTAPNALLMSVVMKKKGHRLTIVDDGRKAVESVKNGEFDIVFMDVQMPVMDGLSATKCIRKLSDKGKATIPIIAMTASALIEDRQACLDAGMNEVQTKPIDFESLFLLLENYMVSE